MATVDSFAEEFVRRARAGMRPSIHVSKRHAETFLGVLAREGFEFAKDCISQITDPELRRIIETIFFSTVGFAAAGAAFGGALAGPPGAQVGAAVGAGVGLVVAVVAITLTARDDGDGLLVAVA